MLYYITVHYMLCYYVTYCIIVCYNILYVGTNGVVAEVPPFPLVNCHGKTWAECGRLWQDVAQKRGNACALETKYGKLYIICAALL